jgi:hypothetical protein
MTVINLLETDKQRMGDDISQADIDKAMQNIERIKKMISIEKRTSDVATKQELANSVIFTSGIAKNKMMKFFSKEWKRQTSASAIGDASRARTGGDMSDDEIISGKAVFIPVRGTEDIVSKYAKIDPSKIIEFDDTIKNIYVKLKEQDDLSKRSKDDACQRMFTLFLLTGGLEANLYDFKLPFLAEAKSVLMRTPRASNGSLSMKSILQDMKISEGRYKEVIFPAIKKALAEILQMTVADMEANRPDRLRLFESTGLNQRLLEKLVNGIINRTVKFSKEELVEIVPFLINLNKTYNTSAYKLLKSKYGSIEEMTSIVVDGAINNDGKFIDILSSLIIQPLESSEMEESIIKELLDEILNEDYKL